MACKFQFRVLIKPARARRVKIKKGRPPRGEPFFLSGVRPEARRRLVVVALAGGLGPLGVARLLLLLAEYGLSGELDLVALLADALNEYLLPLLEFVAHVADAVLGYLTDVEESVRAGEDFDERAEVNDARDRPQVGLSDFGLGGERANLCDGRLRGVAVGCGDEDCAVVFDINLRAGLLDDGAYHLAARPDDVAYAVGVNFDCDDARGVR